MKRSALSDSIRAGIRQTSLAIAKWAGYDAAKISRTVEQHNRLGSNPDSLYAQNQRMRMQWDGEHVVKNTSFGVNVVAKLMMYCSPGQYIPDTGDAVLDGELLDYTTGVWENMGVNCSMQEAFSRTANVEMPMRGDAALVWFRDETGMKLMEVQADRIGEPYTFMPSRAPILNNWQYFAGIYFDQYGANQAYRIYQRGHNDVYFNPEVYPAADVIYFQDNLFQGIRGVTLFHAALETIEKRYSILQSTMDTMKQQSKIAAIASNNSGGSNDISYTQQNLDGTVEYVETYADGAVVKYQFNGDTYQVLRGEHPTEAFVEGMRHLDMHGSLSVRFPYEFLFTPEKSGGAPSRFAFEAAGKEILRRRALYRRKLKIISYVTIMDAVERGIFPARPNITRGSWQFCTLPTADAFRESASDISEIRAGIKTRGQVIAANSGETFPQVLRETVKERIEIVKAVQDANKLLVAEGYEPTLTENNIAQDSDNPGADPGKAPPGEPKAEEKDPPASQT